MAKMIIPAKPETEVYRNTLNEVVIQQTVIGEDDDDSCFVHIAPEDIPQVVTWLQAVAAEIQAKPNPQEPA